MFIQNIKKKQIINRVLMGGEPAWTVDLEEVYIKTN